MAYEVHNSVLMGVRRRRISYADALAFLGSIEKLPIRLADPISHGQVFRLAEQRGLTVYDAAYLELAIREGLPLASLDEALCRAATDSGVRLFTPQTS